MKPLMMNKEKISLQLCFQARSLIIPANEAEMLMAKTRR